MAEAQELYRVILAVRACFQRLGATGNAWHADIGVTASMRAVMESLDQTGPRRVPQIAREKMVSRQHIQTIVDQLIGRKIAVAMPNPGHKRSSLIALTREGKRVFRAMREREKKLLDELAGELHGDGLRVTDETLGRLNTILERKLKQGDEK